MRRQWPVVLPLLLVTACTGVVDQSGPDVVNPPAASDSPLPLPSPTYPDLLPPPGSGQPGDGPSPPLCGDVDPGFCGGTFAPPATGLVPRQPVDAAEQRRLLEEIARLQSLAPGSAMAWGYRNDTGLVDVMYDPATVSDEFVRSLAALGPDVTSRPAPGPAAWRQAGGRAR